MFLIFANINKNMKRESVETRNQIFANISKPKQNKKSPEHPWVDIGT